MEQLRYWYRKYLPNEIRQFIRKLVPFWIELNYFVIKSKKYNLNSEGHGEAKKIKEICNMLNITSGYYVDIGASDGFTSSSTYIFAKNDNFSGLSIELDKKKYLKMKKLYSKFNNTYLLNEKITPNNVVNVLLNQNVPKNFDILNLDIDSYDLFIIKEIISSFAPKIISMEINEKIPPPIYFTVLFDEEHFWQEDSFYGCSLQAAYEEICKKEYKLYTLQYNNAIFISKNTEFEFPELTVSEIYDFGYKNKEDRKDKFAYNADVDAALEMNTTEAINFFDNLYKDYKGLYKLEIR
tara:strand:- start:7004 stop:7888 length:885 start_codon:yes stop_codon:yes gene_type:complete